MARESSQSIKDENVITGRLRGGIGFAKHGDKNYREPMYAAGFHGEQAPLQGSLASTAQAKPARWYQDPSGPKPKISWLTDSARQPGRPLWQAPMSGGGTKGGGLAVIR